MPSQSVINERLDSTSPVTPKLVWVTKYANINSRFTSFTDFGYTDLYQFGISRLETINRKVTSVQAVWTNTRKINTASAGSVTCDAESATNLGTLNIKYAWEVPKIDYRTSSPFVYGYGSMPTSTTNHTNYGAGSLGASATGSLVIAPHGFVVSDPIIATKCCNSVADANSRYPHFPPHFHLFIRQSQYVPTGEYPIADSASNLWDGGCNARGRRGASSYDSLLTDTGRPGDVNSDLNAHGTLPMGGLGYVDDSADVTKHLCIGGIGSSHIEGPGSSGTTLQTSTTTPWANDVVGSALGQAGACYDNGWLHEAARYNANLDSYVNLGCSSWSCLSALEHSQKIDMILWAASHCHAIVIDWAANDMLVKTLPQMKNDFARVTSMIKDRTGAYIIAKVPYPYGAGGNALLDSFGDALIAGNFEHKADAVYNCRPALADFVSTTWRWKAGMSSDNVHLNLTGMNAQVIHWHDYLQSIRGNIR